MLNLTYEIFMKTLANENRLKIINSLRKWPKNVTQICKSINCNQTTLSHNLKKLERCGFVTVKQNGKERIYRLNKKTIGPLMKLIDNHMNQYCKKLCKGGDKK